MSSQQETDSQITPQPVVNKDVDLETILSAWQTATDRLQQTHQLLRGEVKRLTDELEVKNRELARKNRLADLGQMASHVAHEVRNSLVPMTLYLGLLRRRVQGDSQTLDVMEKIDSGFVALESTVNDLLQFTSDRQPSLSSFPLSVLLSEVVETLAPQLHAQSIEVDLDVDPAIAMDADRNMIRRLVLNLLLNAIDAMPQGGDLSILAVASAAGVELEFADDGPGIPEESLEHLFEPFFTTKSEGTGLGLAIVERIADAHSGYLNACNCPQGGAAFTLFVPARSRSTLKAAA